MRPRRHPYHLGLGAFVAGLLLCGAPVWIDLAAAATAGAALACMRAPALGLLAAALLIAGSSTGQARISAIDAPSRALHAGQRLEAAAWLAERPRQSQFGSEAELRIASGPARGAKLMARAPSSFDWPGGGETGTAMTVAGLLEQPHRSRGSSFDYPAYLRRRGIHFELSLEELRGSGARRGGFAGAVDVLRRRSERGLGAGLRGEDRALAAGMVLGEDALISSEVKDDFQRSGLSHLLAVSGQNVMLLGALALPLLALAGLGFRARLVGVAGLVAVYVPLAGAGPSLQRAGVMGAAAIAATAVGRPASRWYVLLLAAATTLIVNPRVAGDPGWQLSFAAVAGIALLVPGMRRWLRWLPGPLGEGVAVTAAAVVATAPLLAHHFGAIQLVALPANLAALPAVAPIMWLGMVQAALGALGGAALLPASLLGALNGVLLDYLRLIARWFGDAPHGQAALPLGSPLSVLVVYAAMVAAFVALRRIARSVEPHALGWAAAWRRLPIPRRRVTVALGILALLAGLWWTTAPPAAPRKLTVSFLDVGQGDATLIQDPSGAAVLFDGGPPEARVARLIRNRGVKRLSIVVATHQSRDHQGGLHEVLRRFPVDLFLDGGDGTRDRDFRQLEAEADARGIRRVAARAGERLRAGGLTIDVLSPQPREAGPPPDDPNQRATVAVVSEGSFRLFLSADAESPSLLPLRLPTVTAMKVPHHGSADPGLPAVLKRLQPQVAAIEVGAHNLYGHPRRSTLAALAKAVPHVYRTDRDGTVTLTVEGSRVRIATAR